VIEGGTDIDAATTLYNVVGGTDLTFGNTEVPVTDPEDGEVTAIFFSRVVNRQVTANVVYQRSADSPLPLDAVATATNAIANRINTNGTGIDVDPGDLLAAGALALPPGTVLTDDPASVATVAFKGVAGQTTPLSITPRENAFTVAQDQVASVLGTTSGPFNLTAGEALAMTINAGALFTLTVNVIDYADISAATITEVVAAFVSQAPVGLVVGSQLAALAFSTAAKGSTANISIGPTSSPGLLAALGLVVASTNGTKSDVLVSFVGP
jgi:hypothetical protein